MQSALKFTPTDDIYTLGRTLHARLYERLRDHDGQGFIAALREWLLFLARFKLREETLAWATPLRGEAFDCLPSNLVQGQDGLVFIDKEWQTNQPVHVGTMALRYLFNIAFSASSRDAFLACFGDEPLLAIRQVLTEIGVEPYAGATQEFSELSEAVRLQVYPHKPPLTKQYLLEIESGAKAKPAPVASQTPAIANLLRRIWRRVFG